MRKFKVGFLALFIANTALTAGFSAGDSLYYKEVGYQTGGIYDSTSNINSFYHLKVEKIDPSGNCYLSSFDSIYTGSTKGIQTLVDTCYCKYSNGAYSCESLFRKDRKSSIFLVLYDTNSSPPTEDTLGAILLNDNRYLMVAHGSSFVGRYDYARNFILLYYGYSVQQGGVSLFGKFGDSLSLTKYNNVALDYTKQFITATSTQKNQTIANNFKMFSGTNALNISSNMSGLCEIKIFNLKGEVLYNGQYRYPGNAQIPIKTHTMVLVKIHDTASNKNMYRSINFLK